MKVKCKLTTVQAQLMEECLQYLILQIDNKDLPFQWYCHVENLKELKYCITKKVFTSQNRQVTIPVGHNTIFSLWQVGLSYGGQMDILTTCIINDLMETAGKKKELQYRKQLAANG